MLPQAFLYSVSFFSSTSLFQNKFGETEFWSALKNSTHIAKLLCKAVT